MSIKKSDNQYNVLSLLQQQANINDEDITAADFFAGGGGVSDALYDMPGVSLQWILNHDKIAIKTNSFHHPGIKTYWSDIYVQDEHELDPVDLVWASIECTQHSKAKGGRDKELGSYTMGWELERYIKYLMPLVIGIENVPEFKKWSPVCENGKPRPDQVGAEFERWKNAICSLGYNYVDDIRNAADDGLPTRRVRYFAFFYRDGINVSFPEFTHSKTGKDGKKKWQACAEHIDLSNEGVSIFGRQFNESLPAHLRKSLSPNTQRRIAGGIKKYAPELNQFICNFYGGKDTHKRSQSIEEPLNTVRTTASQHQLVTLKEKLQFIQDHCHTDNFNTPNEPLNPQLTRQTKQLVQFICQYYGTDQQQNITDPLNTVTTKDRHQLDTIIMNEKIQFIAHHFNSNGNPGSQNQSLEVPLNAVLTTNKASLISILEGFDIKTRFLNREELAACMTFKRDYFSKPGLKLSNKDAIRMIGNAVPPEWARLIIEPIIPEIKAYKQRQKTA
ncbi:DNA cytosine methyltransferase [Flavobacterium cerinum]|uniref:DNA cytosine methyltransferase n=1 Tax=Flavobacterium cerinum TaxID=2502784 RepID=A0A444HEP4_9FLAO|nr:DNA cytosine methyltransferase [Flavobacterium cerinum]RWX03384.1 DNA cytosine methyltransferase [Flavobacterium cerinum]